MLNKIFEEDWKKEIARDSIALGSLPFYFIVIVRAIIGNDIRFVYQLLIAFTLLIIFSFIIKFNHHISRALALTVFISLFYYQLAFAIFASILFIVMVMSSFYLKVKKREVVFGLLFGAISSIISYYLTKIIPE